MIMSLELYINIAAAVRRQLFQMIRKDIGWIGQPK